MHLRLCLIFVLFTRIAFSQDDYHLKPPRDYDKSPAKNAAFIELGGNGALYSLNYDRIYYYKEKIKLSARLGFAINPRGKLIEQGYVIEQNMILLPNPHHVEAGLGVSIQRQYNERCYTVGEYKWENILYAAARLGYRYQKQDDGLFLRVAITPIFMQQSDCGFDAFYFQVWGGISIGMSF